MPGQNGQGKGLRINTVISISALLFTGFGLLFGVLSWSVDRRTAILQDTLEQRLLLAEEVSSEQERQAQEMIAELQTGRDSLLQELREHQAREAAFQKRIEELQTRSGTPPAAKRELQTLLTDSKEAQEDIRKRREILEQENTRNPLPVIPDRYTKEQAFRILGVKPKRPPQDSKP